MQLCNKSIKLKFISNQSFDYYYVLKRKFNKILKFKFE